MTALGTTDISTTVIRNTLSENNNDVGLLCESENINKWGIDRYIVTGAGVNNSQQRLNSVQSSPFKMGDFRKYNHSETAPGIQDAAWQTIGAAANELSFGIKSLGNYTILRYWREGEAGAWTQLANNDASFFRVIRKNAEDTNHDINIDATSGTVTGNDTTSAVEIHALTGDYWAEVDELEDPVNKKRQFRVVLVHPDDADADALQNTIDGTQAGPVLYMDVSPSSLEFEGSHNTPKDITVDWGSSEAGVRVEVSLEDDTFGTNWVQVSTANLETEGEHIIPVNVDNWAPVSAPYQRTARVRFRLRKHTSPTETYEITDVTIVQTYQA